MQAFKRSLGVRASGNLDDELYKPWKPVLESMPLPRHTIILSTINPKTQQPYSIAPPEMLENSASNAVLCNLALFARGTDSPGKENRSSGNGGDASPLSSTDTGLVFCNAFEMQLASTFIQNAFNEPKGAIQWDKKLKRSILRVPGVKTPHLQEAIRFFNSGRMSVDATNVDALLWTATRLGIGRLVEGLVTYLTSLDVVAAAPREVCQLLKDVGLRDMVPTVTERVRTLFWRLQPGQLAALLAWLPTEHATQLLQMEGLQIVSELQVCEALLLLPGATPRAIPNEQHGNNATEQTAAAAQRSVALWRCVRFLALHRAELRSLQSRVGELLQIDTRRLVMQDLGTAWDVQLQEAETTAARVARRVARCEKTLQGESAETSVVSGVSQSPSLSPLEARRVSMSSSAAGRRGGSPCRRRPLAQPRHSCQDTTFFTVHLSELQALLQVQSNEADDFVTWETLPQDVGELTLRLSVTRTALPTPGTSAAQCASGGKGGLSAHAPHDSHSLLHSSNKASTPTSVGSQASRSGRRLLGKVGPDTPWEASTARAEPGRGTARSTRLPAPGPPTTPKSGGWPSADSPIDGGLSGSFYPTSRQGAPPPWRSITSRRSPQATMHPPNPPSPPAEKAPVQARSQLSYAPGASRPPPLALKVPAEAPRPPWLDESQSGSGAKGTPRTTRIHSASIKGSVSPVLDKAGVAQKKNHAAEPREAADPEAAWSPSKWAHLAHHPASSSSKMYCGIDTAQVEPKPDRSRSVDSSPRSFQWGVRLLADTGEAATADQDAGPVEVAVPVEAFDIFCLAQRSEHDSRGGGEAPDPRLIGNMTTFEVPFKNRRTLGCGPADWLSQALAWRPAWTDDKSGRPTSITIGIHLYHSCSASAAGQGHHA